MEKRIELEKRGRDANQITELNLDNARSTSIVGLTTEFVNLEYLSLVNVGLTSLKGLPALPNLQRIEISDNLISNGLHHLVTCKKLTAINLSNNRIAQIKELEPLKQLEHLKNLDLFHNEVTSVENYRKTVFAMIPTLQFLDEVDINSTDSEDEPQIRDEEDEDDDDEEDEDEDEDDDEDDDDDESDDDEDEDEDVEGESRRALRRKKQKKSAGSAHPSSNTHGKNLPGAKTGAGGCLTSSGGPIVVSSSGAMPSTQGKTSSTEMSRMSTMLFGSNDDDDDDDEDDDDEEPDEDEDEEDDDDGSDQDSDDDVAVVSAPLQRNVRRSANSDEEDDDDDGDDDDEDDDEDDDDDDSEEDAGLAANKGPHNVPSRNLDAVAPISSTSFDVGVANDEDDDDNVDDTDYDLDAVNRSMELRELYNDNLDALSDNEFRLDSQFLDDDDDDDDIDDDFDDDDFTAGASSSVLIDESGLSSFKDDGSIGGATKEASAAIDESTDSGNARNTSGVSSSEAAAKANRSRDKRSFSGDEEDADNNENFPADFKENITGSGKKQKVATDDDDGDNDDPAATTN